MGGNLHIVLEDTNVEDGHVAFCLDRVEAARDAPGVELASLLMQMDEDAAEESLREALRVTPRASEEGEDMSALTCNRCGPIAECSCPDIDDKLRSASDSPTIMFKWCRACDRHFARCRCEVPAFYVRSGGPPDHRGYVQASWLESCAREKAVVRFKLRTGAIDGSVVAFDTFSILIHPTPAHSRDPAGRTMLLFKHGIDAMFKLAVTEAKS